MNLKRPINLSELAINYASFDQIVDPQKIFYTLTCSASKLKKKKYQTF